MTAGLTQSIGSTPSVELCPVCGGASSRQRSVLRAGRVDVCGTCGSWYRVPRPTIDELLKIYDQDYYKAWGLDQDADIALRTKQATFAPLLKLVAPHFGPRVERPRVLDVGAATGILLDMAAAIGWDCFGLELNPFSAGVLRERFGADHVFQGELTACTFPPGTFDAIMMTDLIEHVLDVPGTLKAAGGLLRPGGVLCITTPRIDSWSRGAMGSKWLHFKEEHIQYFSADGMSRALSAAGFTEVSIKSATKRLTQDYLYIQLKTYPHWLLTPIVRVARALTISPLRKLPLNYRCGEMLVLASKR